MKMKIPCGELSNGRNIPLIGLGTWQLLGDELIRSIKDAIDVGYRLIDCAMRYENEKEIGQIFEEMFRDGTVKRSDLFVTSKLWNTFHRPDLVEKTCRKSLEDLRLDYLDLYLLHWPVAFREDVPYIASEETKLNHKIPFSDVPLEDTWAAMEKLVDKGLVRSIGFCNFNSEQVSRILKLAKVPPVINQVECHAWFNQSKLRAFCLERDIVLQAFAPLGSPQRRWAQKDDPILLNDPTLAEIAQKYRKQPAQILIKFQVQRNIIPLPKSRSKERLLANIDIFDFSLDQSDMKRLEEMDKGQRLFPMNDAKGHKEYPFDIEF